MKRGFTIVELLAVVGIIAILATIVVITSVGSIHEARAHRANAMAVALQHAISTYYAQVGKWPDAIENKISNSTDDILEFSASDTDKILQQVVGKGFGKSGTRSMLIDASSLLVANKSKLGSAGEKRIPAVEFTVAANRNSEHCINFNNMAFGFQDPDTGHFKRYWVTYDTKTDSVQVLQEKPEGAIW